MLQNISFSARGGLEVQLVKISKIEAKKKRETYEHFRSQMNKMSDEIDSTCGNIAPELNLF